MKKRLVLKQESIRMLETKDLGKIAGGWIRPPLTWSCPQPTATGCR